jgi:hypothetical protein
MRRQRARREGEKMTVYVVTTGEYSDYGIKAIFSAKELAEKYVADCLTDKYDFPAIVEWELDTEIGKVKRTCFRCEMPGGRCWSYETIALPTLRVPENHIDDLQHLGKFVANSYVSEDHARKLAIEEHQRRLRETVKP